MTVQELIDYGLLELIDYKNGLYYLEFIYSKDETFAQYRGELTENYNFLGTITCDEDGCIYKAIVKSYCVIEHDPQIFIGFPQIINKVHKLTLNDLFKVDKDGIPYVDLVRIKDSIQKKCSTLWANSIKGNNNCSTIRIRQSNVSTVEYVGETQDKVKSQEFFKNEQSKFKLLADSVVTGSKHIKDGLEHIAGSISVGMEKNALVHMYDEGNSYIYHHGGT